MRSVAASLLLAGLASIRGVAGHGYLKEIHLDGQSYTGWLADKYPYMNDPPDTIGWSTTVTDNGFVPPNMYSSADIICHEGAQPSDIGGQISAGGTVEFTWNTWPVSHHGPIINYLAKVDGDFGSINKNSLRFFKFDAGGLISGSNPGTWVTDTMISNGFTSSARIPSSIAPGKYVLRHEIIALHAAGNQNGAQSYPQCINIEVTGGGGANPSGEPATSFYSPSDPGILFNLYTSFSSYPMPGPPLYSG